MLILQSSFYSTLWHIHKGFMMRHLQFIMCMDWCTSVKIWGLSAHWMVFLLSFWKWLANFKEICQKLVLQLAKRISDTSFAGGIRIKKKLNCVSPRQKYNWFLLNNKNIVFIKKKISESHFFCYQIDISSGGSDELFKKPISSKVLHIKVINRATRNENIEISKNDLIQKCIYVPFKTRFILFPMLHSVK